MHQDALDRIVGEWNYIRPDLDSVPLAVLGRLQRLAGLVRRQVDDTLKPYGLAWELLDVLGRTLERTALSAGATMTTLNATALPTGSYFVRIADGASQQIARVQLP